MAIYTAQPMSADTSV